MADTNTEAMDASSKPSAPTRTEVFAKGEQEIDPYLGSTSSKGKNWWTDIPLHDVIYYQRFAYDLSTTKLGKGFTKYAKPVDAKEIVASSGASKVFNTPDKFEMELNVDRFTVNELKLTRDGEFMILEGSHEEKEEGGGLVSRSFKRLIQLPRECRLDRVTSVYRHGNLVITAPKDTAAKPPVIHIA